MPHVRLQIVCILNTSKQSVTITQLIIAGELTELRQQHQAKLQELQTMQTQLTESRGNTTINDNIAQRQKLEQDLIESQEDFEKTMADEMSVRAETECTCSSSRSM